MNLRFLADSNMPAVGEVFSTLGDVRTTNGRDLSAVQLADIDVLLVRSVTRVDADLLRDTPVKFVGSATSGLDHIDQDYLRDNNIGFAHAPGANANSVVEYVLAAICAAQDTLEALLAGAIVGIVGYGHVGKALATRLQALGIDYCVYDPWLDQSTVVNGQPLETVLASEVLTLHCELANQQPWPSRHLIGAGQLQQLQPGTLLINASRGAVVDNAALLQHLQGNASLQTVLDVWENEPAIDSALLEKVTLGTPHIAGYSLDAKLLATRILRDAVSTHFDLPSVRDASATAAATRLQLPNGLNGAALIRHLVQARYDIAADDARLRTVTLDNKHDAAKSFDELRKNYHARRELNGSTIYGGSQTPDIKPLCEALGCRLVAMETDK